MQSSVLLSSPSRVFLSSRLTALFDSEAWQHRLPAHDVYVVEPESHGTDAVDRRVWLVMADVIAHERLGHAELDVIVDMGIVGVINLRDQNLVTGLHDQRVQCGQVDRTLVLGGEDFPTKPSVGIGYPIIFTVWSQKRPSLSVLNLPRKFISACSGSWFSSSPTGERVPYVNLRIG